LGETGGAPATGAAGALDVRSGVLVVLGCVVAVGGVVAVGAAAELDAADDVVAAAAGAVVVPLAVDEPAGDRDRATLGQVLRAGVCLGTEGRDVDEHRLVLLVVDREPQLADLAVVVKLLEDRVGSEVADQGDRVNCGC
jgi:hypothetical protein